MSLFFSNIGRFVFFLYVFLIPLDNVFLFSFGDASHLIGLIAFLLCLIRHNCLSLLGDKTFYTSLLFLLSCIVSQLLSQQEFNNGFQTIFSYSQLICSAWMTSLYLEKEKDLNLFGVFFSLGALLGVLLSLTPSYSHYVNYYRSERFFLYGTDPNEYAFSIALSCLFVLKHIFIGSKYKTFIYYFLLLLFLHFLLKTGSRSAVVALVPSAILCSLLFDKKRLVLLELSSLVLFIVIYLFIASDNIDLSRFSNTIFTGDTANRAEIYPAAFHLFTQKPFFGFGDGLFPFLLGQKVSFQPQELSGPYRGLLAHNQVLQLLGANGLIGFLFFMNFLYQAIKPVFRFLLYPNAKYLVSAVLLTFIFSMFINVAHLKAFWALVGCCLFFKSRRIK